MLGSLHPINWGRLHLALEWYTTKHGYQYVEVPWAVPRRVTQMTLPEGAHPYMLGAFPYTAQSEDLIGSAEQAFLHLILEGDLKPGRYVACSPCFRDEPVQDTFHQQRFMKVELIDTRPDADFRSLLTDATEFFLHVLQDRVLKEPLQRVDQSTLSGETQIDLHWRGVEIGSYGQRSVEGTTWSYGTGLAEPRFGVLLSGSR